MFSEEQLSFLSDKSNFILKNEADASVSKLLYSFQETISRLLAEKRFPLPTKISKLPGKVTKGNNLKGFPFQVCDYPSTFIQHDIFSFRSIIWYGHFFSFNLIISGKPREDYTIDLSKLANKGYKIFMNEAIWEVDPINATSIDISTGQLNTITERIEKCSGFKIFKAYDLNHIYDFERLGVECFEELFSTN